MIGLIVHPADMISLAGTSHRPKNHPTISTTADQNRTPAGLFSSADLAPFSVGINTSV